MGERLPGGEGSEYRLRIFFGWTVDEVLAELAREVFEHLPMPMLEVQLRRQGIWRIHRLAPLALSELDAVAQREFGAAIGHYLSRRWRKPKRTEHLRYDLAALHDPHKSLPPSSPRTLQQFIRVGRRLGVNVELIQRQDYGRLAEFDALFIRETTRIDHYTYRFSHKAEGEGLAVIDDPDSILRCTNKVYLAELLQIHRIPMLDTFIIRRSDLKRLERWLPYPWNLLQATHRIIFRRSAPPQGSVRSLSASSAACSCPRRRRHEAFPWPRQPVG